MFNRQTRDQLTVNKIKKKIQSNSSNKFNSQSHPHSYSTFQKSFKNEKKLENCDDSSMEFFKSNQSYSSENDSPLKNINSNKLRLSSSSSSSNLSPKNLSQIISNRSQPIKSSINISKLNDFTHALVFWSDEDKFSIVSVHAIHTKNGEKIIEGQVYRISYGNKIFSGVVKIMGTQKKCQEILDSICMKAEEESGYQEKFQRCHIVNKNKNEKQNKVANQIKSLQSENLGLKEKLVKLTEALDKIQQEKKNLEIDKLSLEEKIKKFQETFYMVHKQDKFFTCQQMNLKLNTIIQDLKKMTRND